MATRQRAAAPKISDAMEAGWRTLGQETNGHFATLEGDELVKACALGAACYAVGVAPPDFCDFDIPFPRALRKLPQKRRRELEARNQYRKDAYAAPRWDPETVKTIGDAIIVMNDILKLPKEELVATVRRWGY